ncbi:hypothetical protein [Nostoc cycadae]|uniref:Uncharacterized protein n=1 Tax=Nostoc cycadae WK-1 TaxID=1861711 RepID=A0A2H6LR83_9NOSO|nr:hypothetical protein [Nostoc cycadae]GBE95708.1 hypothetical protein NCWK1_5496 [Nostoc cycadae WK-1]
MAPAPVVAPATARLAFIPLRVITVNKITITIKQVQPAILLSKLEFSKSNDTKLPEKAEKNPDAPDSKHKEIICKTALLGSNPAFA